MEYNCKLRGQIQDVSCCLLGRLSRSSSKASKSDHYTTAPSVSAELIVTKAEEKQYEIIAEEE